MAFGGLGWIYLGWDKVLSRWVVLKGLLNTKDEAATLAAVQERKFLAAVKHPNIVGVYNFVSHGTEGYIVMEYVGGKTIKELRQERGPLPPTEAIAYIHRILGAFAYLEREGLVYCDFKPDNFMLEDDDVKLIDMGGVRRVDDTGGDVYGTKGYSAPEGSDSPSFVSDLYTVARTLAVLVITFKFSSDFEFSLPTPDQEPLFAQYDSLYRFLQKATRENPDGRFQSAEEMSEQLLGVLREIVAATATPKPHQSTLFSDEVDGDEEPGTPSFRTLPALKVDAGDPAANSILAAGAIVDPSRRALLFEKDASTYPDSAEAPLRLALCHIETSNIPAAEKWLAQVAKSDPFDWRVQWYRGLAFLAQGKFKEARGQFDFVYSEAPGELPPKLGVAIAAELEGDRNTAIKFYDVVSRTDPAFTSASFGLARLLAQSGNRYAAVSAYGRVPPTSSRHPLAQTDLARALLDGKSAPPGSSELEQAGKVIEALRGILDGSRLHTLSAELLLTAIEQIRSKALTPNGNARILGQALEESALRTAAEQELRECARFASSPEEKYALVDMANRERPQTLF